MTQFVSVAPCLKVLSCIKKGITFDPWPESFPWGRQCLCETEMYFHDDLHLSFQCWLWMRASSNLFMLKKEASVVVPKTVVLQVKPFSVTKNNFSHKNGIFRAWMVLSPCEIFLFVTIFILLSLKALGVAIVIARYTITGCCSQSQWLHFLNNNSKNNNNKTSN